MDGLKHIAASFFFCRAIISKVFLQKLRIKYPSSGGGLPPGVPCSLKLAVVGRECNERLDYFRKQQGRGAVKDGIQLRNKSKKMTENASLWRWLQTPGFLSARKLAELASFHFLIEST